ncbi:hypothetical protein COBT_000012 [Conglomerata obtusa]
MLNCTYTKDKIKKSKIWKDGFILLDNKRINLYDEERKKIYSFIYKNLGEEIITPMYIIYCEQLVRADENESEEVSMPLASRKKNVQRESKQMEISKKRIEQNLNVKNVKVNHYVNSDNIDTNNHRNKKETWNCNSGNVKNINNDDSYIESNTNKTKRTKAEIFDLLKK